MAAAADKWTRIEIAFRNDGAPLSEIRSKFHVSITELLAHAHERGWKHGDRRDPPPDPPGGGDSGNDQPEHAPPSNLPALVARENLRRKREEVASEVIDDHRLICRDLRDLFFGHVAQIRELDERLLTINEALEKARLESDPKRANEHLKNATQAQILRSRMLRDAVEVGDTLLKMEGRAWGIDKLDKGDDQKSDEERFQEFLDKLQTPLAPNDLPDNVLAFDKKLSKK